MSARTRGALLVAAAVILLVVVGVVLLRADDDAYDRTRTTDDAMAVPDVVLQAPTEEVVVTGFVFVDPSWPEPRLCASRRRGDPPTCVGPYVRLSGLALDRVPLDRDGDVAHSPEAVLLAGRLRGDAFEATDVVTR